MADRQKAPVRPQLAASMRSSSYLSDHQQYRPPRQPEPRQGIDSVVELPSSAPASSAPPKPKVVLPFNGVPSEDNPPTIVESGLSHSFSHPNCAPAPGLSSDRLVVTLFYNRSACHHDVAAVAAAGGIAAAAHSSTSSPPSPPPFTALPLTSNLDSVAHPDVAHVADPLPANMAPTTDPDAFPLEPPTHESEQLDHLYGSYISPLCITSFLHLMSSFPQSRGAREPHSSHRCLDSQENPRVVELTLSPAPSAAYLSLPDLRKHETIYRFEREWNVDVALQPDLVWRRYPRLVVFDMDSTLISQEVIELMADTVKDPPDLGLRVADITRRAMQGELGFEESFRERLALLKGISASVFDDLRPIIQLTKGARELVRALKRLGAKTAVLSGGFQPLTSWLARELGIDYAHANRVVILDGKLSGEVEGTIVGKERKRDLLVEIAGKERIDLAQVVAVGDGANDLLMMEKAGLGVAWNAKPRVQMEADARLNGESLLDLLYLFGFTSEEITMLAK